ncbi:hypothetical protein IU474_06075 [Nocardia otitidiscaviarum]|uniref:hypothetical protein n=1 Tax=Nocardia otitidiscaviarum TaxID=1823 RepID=UPI0018942AD7|nr:hypothetical protein [Nocardia otitidiscaviarum]MBF6236645.1 hypothetical protein [Nocardia otitidiscaviarum]
MRDFMGNHVSQVDEYGHAVDIDRISVTTMVWGSFRVKYADHIDRVCVDVVEGPPGRADMSMQLTLAQATLLRELLDAGIADALAANVIEVDAIAGEVAS